MTADPRDQPPAYFWYTYSLAEHRVTCDRCGEKSPEPTADDLAVAKTQPTWGGYPVTGTRAAMEAWAERHEGACPKKLQWARQGAERESERLRVLNPGVRGL
jgi:hypothetical protein